MNQIETCTPGAEDAFFRSSLDIPLDHEFRKMSFVELASLLSSSEIGSAKFIVVERELKNRLAKDQAKINLPNMLWAACIGGTFALAGIVLGAYLNNSSYSKNPSPSAAVQQVNKSNFAEDATSGNVMPDATVIEKSTPHPALIQNNAQPRTAR